MLVFVAESEALSIYRISARAEDINAIKAAFNLGKRSLYLTVFVLVTASCLVFPCTELAMALLVLIFKNLVLVDFKESCALQTLPLAIP